MAHSYTNLLVHVVFSTKNRGKDLTAEVRRELYPYLARLAQEQNAQAQAIGGGVDHVHLLLACSPTVAVAKLVGFLKANSSRWLRGRFNLHFAWQEGYGAFSVSQSKCAEVREYIRNQQEHHQRTSFEDEYVSLLKRNEIEFENERLWKSPEGAEYCSPGRKPWAKEDWPTA